MKASLLAISVLIIAGLLISAAPSALTQNANSSTTSQNANSSMSSQNTNKSPGRSTKKPQAIELKATKAPATRGSEPDANIKNDKQSNDPNAKGTPPSSKGGAKTRGGGDCEVRVDNWTNYYIKIYVDGIYRGVLDRYGDAVIYVGVGETRVYGRADFDDGSYLYWGPKTYDCGPNQYIYFKMTE